MNDSVSYGLNGPIALGTVQKLPTSTIDLLRACTVLPTFSSFVQELVLNSLDAVATEIEIVVDFSSFSLDVVDNGRGICQSDLVHRIGKFNLTSNNMNKGSYGCRGEAVAAALVLSTVAIESRVQGKQPFKFTFGENFQSRIGIRKAVGTTVSIRNIFGNLAVRQKSMKSLEELLHIKEFIRNISMLHYHVQFSLFDSSSGCRSNILTLLPQKSVAARFGSFHSTNLLAKLTPVSSSYEIFSISGLISFPTISCCHWNRDCEYLFVNHRWLKGNNFISRLIEAVFQDTLSLKASGGPSPMHHGSSAASSKTGVYPMFVLQLTLPNECIDVLSEKDKSNIIFQDKAGIIECLRKLLKALALSCDPKLDSVIDRFWSDRIQDPAHRVCQSLSQYPHSPSTNEDVVAPMPSAVTSEMVTRIVDNSSKNYYRNRIPGSRFDVCERPSAGYFQVVTSAAAATPSPPSPMQLPVQHNLDQGDAFADAFSFASDVFMGCTKDAASSRHRSTLSQYCLSGNDIRSTTIMTQSSPSEMPAESLIHPAKRSRTAASAFIDDDDYASSQLSPSFGVTVFRNNWLEEQFDTLLQAEMQAESCPDVENSQIHQSFGDFPHLDGDHVEVQTNALPFDEQEEGSAIDVDTVIPGPNHIGIAMYPSRSVLNPSLIPRDALMAGKFIGQADNKYLLVLLPDSEDLVIVDQHAADERIQLESLSNKNCHCSSMCSACYVTKEARKFKKSKSVPIDDVDVSLLSSDHARDIIRRWDFDYSIEPTCSRAGSAVRVMLHSSPIILGEHLTAGDFIEFVRWLAENPYAATHATRPPAVARIFASKACRSAVRFGDALDAGKCIQIIADLGKTMFPFQCAHGRPSIVPLVNLGELLTQRRKKQVDARDGVVDVATWLKDID